MNDKSQKDLEKAKEYFLELRLIESYNILRRYFDRLPFKPERAHAEYIGIFARVLSELGKKNELNFYMSELERVQIKLDSPEIDYQLAMIYVHADPPQYRAAKALLEKVIRHEDSKEFAIKAKVTLAYCYDTLEGDVASCRMLIDSVGPVQDILLKNIIDTWKAKILKDERRFAEAEALLNQFFKGRTPEDDWYSYFTGRLIQIFLYLDWGKKEKVGKLLNEAKALADDKPLKTIKKQLQAVEERLRKESDLGPVQFVKNGKIRTLKYLDKSFSLDAGSSSDRLLLLLLEDGVMDKTQIVRTLYERQYERETDDQLIYYHIHSLRKYLKKVGLPPEVIKSDGLGYRFVTKVEKVEET